MANSRVARRKTWIGCAGGPSRLVITLCGAVITGGFGCGLWDSEAENPVTPQPQSTELYIRVVSTEDTNGGASVFMLVRQTTAVDFSRQSYDDLVETLSQRSDPVTVLSEAVPPAVEQHYQVSRPESGTLGVYFLFVHPNGERWRYLIPQGPEVRGLEVVLGVDGITTVRLAKDKRQTPAAKSVDNAAGEQRLGTGKKLP